MTRCKHLEPAEAVALTESGEVPVEAYNCGYTDAHPERFANMPRWLLREAISGRGFEWRKDCPGCPAFEAVNKQS